MLTADPPTSRASIAMLDVVATTRTSARAGSAAASTAAIAMAIFMMCLPTSSSQNRWAPCAPRLIWNCTYTCWKVCRSPFQTSPALYCTRSRENSVGLNVRAAE